MISALPVSRYRAVGVLVALLTVVGCGGGSKPTGGPRELVILHTNDIHGKFRDTPATWRDGNPPIGGFANLSAYVEEARAAAPDRTVLLDAGDLMTGNPICDYDYLDIEGGAMMAFMNLMGYDAMALGNHEFDHGLESLSALLSLAKFPVLSANTFRPDGELTAPLRYVIVERNGVRIGVIGLLTESLYSVAAPSKLAGTRVESMVESARSIIEKIDDETDLIVLLTHVGVDGDRELARRVEGVDLIVGGHSHTRLEEPEIVNGVIIVQAGAYNRNLGRVSITVENDAITAYAAELIELWPKTGGREQIVSMVDAYSERIDREFGAVIGNLATAWEREYHGESNIGNWLTDAMREYAGGDFAVLNSGGIRKNVAAGPITRLDVLEVLPFSNAVTTFTCTGNELLTLMRHNALAAAHESHGILQVSGIRYRYAVDADEVTLIEATVGGNPVDPGATYTGVTVDYVTHGNAMRLLGFEPSQAVIEGTTVAAVVESAVEQAGTIDSRVEGRMVDASAEATRAG